MLVTVAICTWNRAPLLARTLTEFRKLQIPSDVEWELLVVNNNSTDDTPDVVELHARHLPLRCLFESKQGHCHARNCAIAVAAGELLLWTDDDVLVDPNWLAEYAAAARQWTDAAFFGGPIHPWFEIEPPPWLKRNFSIVEGAYAMLHLGDTIRPCDPADDGPYGANMAFRTDVLRQHLFNPRLGLIGNQSTRGDEVDVLRRLRDRGHRGVWVGTARVRHYIPAERLTTRYLWDYFRGGGRSDVRAGGFQDGARLWGAPRWIVRQYWKSRLQSWCLSPLKGPGWLRAFKRAAYCKGVMEEARANHNSQISMIHANEIQQPVNEL